MPPDRLPAVLLARIAVVVALVAAACSPTATSYPAAASAAAPPGVHPVAAEVLLVNGQVPTGPTTTAPITVGDVHDAPWMLYLEASQAAGFDFTPAQGRAGTLLRTPIRGAEPDATAFVLVVDGRVAGAWIGPGGSSSGVLPISGRP